MQSCDPSPALPLASWLTDYSWILAYVPLMPACRESSRGASDGDVWQRGAAQQEEQGGGGRFSRQNSRDDGFSAPPRPPSRDFGDRRDG